MKIRVNPCNLTHYLRQKKVLNIFLKIHTVVDLCQRNSWLKAEFSILNWFLRKMPLYVVGSIQGPAAGSQLLLYNTCNIRILTFFLLQTFYLHFLNMFSHFLNRFTHFLIRFTHFLNRFTHFLNRFTHFLNRFRSFSESVYTFSK